MSTSPTSPAPSTTFRLGEYLSRGFQGVFDQFPSWLAQMAICAAIGLAALLCCVLPVFLVTGPLSCGLHYCGLRAIRKEPVDVQALARGWTFAGRSMVAALALMMMQMIPALLLYCAFAGGFAVMIGTGGFGTAPMRVAPAAPPVAAPMAGPRQAPGEEGQAAGMQAEADEPVDGADEAPAGAAPGPPGAMPAPFPGRAGPPMPTRREAAMLVMMLVMYGLMLLGGVVMMAFTLWFQTKTMFVMPLIADRGASFMEAFELSWQFTRKGFWELLLVNFLALLLSNLGMYFCYVGLLATFPLYYTIIAAAYEGHALPQFEPPAEQGS